jgi:phosphatidylserine/phosphatidylglycerophosphate/cardiolipin synthase-like enzyme
MKKIFIYLFIFSIILSACDSATATDTSTPPTPPPNDSATSTPAPLIDIPLGAGYGVDGGWFELYFTDPTSPLASQETGGPDGPLAAAIDSARLTVDVAIYSLSLNSVRDALIRAHKRGVQVRMVMESDNLDSTDPQKLKAAGIPILGDRREGLMHDKFMVIDNSEVWLGSMNFTDSGAYTDNNNLMRIHSTEMAENYTKEFEEMFVDDKFGPDVVAETPHPRVIIDGTPIDVYFSPDDHVQDSFVELIENAQESINFMAFSFTSDLIGDAVLASTEQDVIVSGVMESDQVKSNIGTEFDRFSQAGLDVLLDGNKGLMHHKVMIVDESIVIFGSYNFTASAETKNDETLIVIYNEEIAAQFMDEFQRVYSQAQAVR